MSENKVPRNYDRYSVSGTGPNGDRNRYSETLQVRKSGGKKTVTGQSVKRGFAERLFGRKIAKKLGLAKGGIFFGGEKKFVPMPMPRSESARRTSVGLGPRRPHD